MPNNTGTLVIAPIRPQSDQDTFPSAHANELLGGLHAVRTVEERDRIPDERRIEGMFCAVAEPEPQIYQLVGGTTNADWAPLYVHRPDYADVGDYITNPANGVLFGFKAPRRYQWTGGEITLVEPHPGGASGTEPLVIAVHVGGAEVARVEVAPGKTEGVASGFPVTFEAGDLVSTVLSGAASQQEIYYVFPGLVLPPAPVQQG